MLAGERFFLTSEDDKNDRTASCPVTEVCAMSAIRLFPFVPSYLMLTRTAFAIRAAVAVEINRAYALKKRARKLKKILAVSG